MDRDELADALRALDRRLTEPCELVIVGGAAMILHFGAARATRDVDVLVLSGRAGSLREAARRVAQDRGLEEDWLNDGVKAFTASLPEDFASRLSRLDLGLTRLSLFALGGPEQAAMKLAALREQDIEDLEILLPGLSDGERATLLTTIKGVDTVRPDWAQKMGLYLEELGWTIE